MEASIKDRVEEETKAMEELSMNSNKRSTPPSPAYFTPTAPVIQDAKKLNNSSTPSANSALPSSFVASSPHTIVVPAPPSTMGESKGDAMQSGNDSMGDDDHMPTSAEKKQSGGRWSPEEDEILKKTVMELGAKNWKKISSVAFQGKRSDVQCLHRWQKVLRPGLVKGSWTKMEDEIVLSMVRKHGVGNIKWSVIAAQLPGRLGKQCRERWFNHLDPDLKKEPWTAEEDKILMEAQATMGNRWCQIAQLLPGRSENAVKNRWNSAMRRKFQLAKEKEKGEGKASKPKKERKKKEPKDGAKSIAAKMQDASMQLFQQMNEGTLFFKQPVGQAGELGMVPLSPSLEESKVEISKITGKPKRKYKKRAPKVQANDDAEDQTFLTDLFSYEQQLDAAKAAAVGGRKKNADAKGKAGKTGKTNKVTAAMDAFWPDLGGVSALGGPSTMDFSVNMFSNNDFVTGAGVGFPNPGGANVRSGNYGLLDEGLSAKSKKNKNIQQHIAQDSMANFDFFGTSGADLMFSSGGKNGSLDPGATLHADDHTNGLFDDLNFLNMPLDYSDARFDASIQGSNLGSMSLNGLHRESDDQTGTNMLDQLCDDFFPVDMLNLKSF